MFIFYIISYAFLGLILGSFSSALSHRVPKGKNWVNERSACSSCQHDLGPLDLIPLLSWFCSHGKCRYCGAKVSWIYPLYEVICAVLALIIFLVMGSGAHGVFLLIALPFLFSLTVIDIRKMILPNQLVFILFVLGLFRLVYFYIVENNESFLIAALSGMVVFLMFSLLLATLAKKILKKEAMGMGDVKFFGVAGLWLGIDNLPAFLIMSGVIGIVFALLWQKFFHNKIFPFGPSLILSFYLINLSI